MKSHYLKTNAEYFDAVKSGEKTFELRINDRNFQIGDLLILMRTDPGACAQKYDDIIPGERLLKTISYIFDGGKFGLEKGYCILGLKPVLDD